MSIRPLEKKQKDGFIPKLIFLLLLLCAAFVLNFVIKNRVKKPENILGAENIQKPAPVNIVKDIKKISGGITSESKSLTENVLGTTTNIVATIASKSSEIVSQVVFDNTIGKVIEQVKKLPASEQEKIKQEICK